MDTIFFSIITLLSIISWFISLVNYFTHDDIKQGRIVKDFEVQSLFSTFVPLEIGIHIVITGLLLYRGYYILALINLPLFVYNMRQLFRVEYKYERLEGLNLGNQ